MQKRFLNKFAITDSSISCLQFANLVCDFHIILHSLACCVFEDVFAQYSFKEVCSLQNLAKRGSCIEIQYEQSIFQGGSIFSHIKHCTLTKYYLPCLFLFLKSYFSTTGNASFVLNMKIRS